MPRWSVRDPADLLQFLDEVDLGVQSPGGIGEHQVVISGISPLDGIEDNRARVAAFSAAHNRHPCTLGPKLELLGSSRPERVSCSKDDRTAICTLTTRDLPDRRGLPDTVHPDKEPHIRGTFQEVEVDAPGCLERGTEIGLQRVENCVRALQLTRTDS